MVTIPTNEHRIPFCRPFLLLSPLTALSLRANFLTFDVWFGAQRTIRMGCAASSDQPASRATVPPRQGHHRRARTMPTPSDPQLATFFPHESAAHAPRDRYGERAGDGDVEAGLWEPVPLVNGSSTTAAAALAGGAGTVPADKSAAQKNPLASFDSTSVSQLGPAL